MTWLQNAVQPGGTAFPALPPPLSASSAAVLAANPRFRRRGLARPHSAKRLATAKRCRLHEGMTQIVFRAWIRNRAGVCGRGSGADEDAQGIPFVGRAGQLLTQMIEKHGAQGKASRWRGQDVYICNVVKCRPPATARRSRTKWRSAARSLFQQPRGDPAPKPSCALGGTAAKACCLDRRRASPACAATGSTGAGFR